MIHFSTRMSVHVHTAWVNPWPFKENCSILRGQFLKRSLGEYKSTEFSQGLGRNQLYDLSKWATLYPFLPAQEGQDRPWQVQQRQTLSPDNCTENLPNYLTICGPSSEQEEGRRKAGSSRERASAYAGVKANFLGWACSLSHSAAR